jgi:hypothetical protein
MKYLDLYEQVSRVGSWYIHAADEIDSIFGFAVSVGDSIFVMDSDDEREVTEDFDYAVKEILGDEPTHILIRRDSDGIRIGTAVVSTSKDYAVGYAHGVGGDKIYDMYAHRSINV